MTIAWLDLETTGLDPKRDSILEVGIILTTDTKLDEIARFHSLVRPMHLRGVEVMGDYVLNMHTKSGLLGELYDFDQRIDPGPHGHPLRDHIPAPGRVELDVMQWLHNVSRNPADTEADTKRTLRGIPLAGNSVHFDRAFIQEHMPDLEALFSHRNVDVSTVTELAKRWAPLVHKGRPGVRPDGTVEPTHRSLDDLAASIKTALYYRDTLFTPPITIDCSKEPIVMPSIP